jgi:hypothetical protein
VEPFTLNRKFIEQDVIDNFLSCIWTERYYGDSEVELVVPGTLEMFKKLTPGTFIGLEGSDEIMIIDTATIEKDKLKVVGSSLLMFLNNRFIRVSAAHEDRYWYLEGVPGWLLWAIVYYMCVTGSPYLNGTYPTGVTNPQSLAIPGLGLKDYDKTGASVKVGIPYGPVYDAMREIATTYQVGMQITLESVTDTDFTLGFRSYRGLDHTSGQNVNPIVRFSPQMDSLASIKELQSIASFKTLTYAFAPSNPGGLATTPGRDALSGDQYTGFDLRAQLIFTEDVTTDMVGGSAANLLAILNTRAHDANTNHPYIKTVDGEIVPQNQFKYGVHYNLGDVIEVQGNSGVVSTSRVTEYIRAEDENGERAYPTVAMLG